MKGVVAVERREREGRQQEVGCGVASMVSSGKLFVKGGKDGKR